MDSFEAEMRERLATLEQDGKSVHRRLDNLEELTESIHAIAGEMKAMRESMEGVQESVNTLNNRVVEVENRPKKRYDTIITAVITAIAAFLVGKLF